MLIFENRWRPQDQDEHPVRLVGKAKGVDKGGALVRKESWLKVAGFREMHAITSM